MNYLYTYLIAVQLMVISMPLVAQEDRLIIGRTTGQLSLEGESEIRIFGFSNSLSGQINLPGTQITALEGDTVNLDFWNISQGNPHSLKIDGIELTQYTEQGEILLKKEPIHHMDHGFYSFVASTPGTYLYFSPENHPFNLQAGMFGSVVILPKAKSTPPTTPMTELFWCSHEIDPNWHTDTLMDLESEDAFNAIDLPVYKPIHFLINGRSANQMHMNGLNKSPVLLRLINAGLYHHEIAFPPSLQITVKSGNASSLTTSKKGSKVLLKQGECIELVAISMISNKKEHVRYCFIDPIKGKIRHKADIPIQSSHSNDPQ